MSNIFYPCLHFFIIVWLCATEECNVHIFIESWWGLESLPGGSVVSCCADSDCGSEKPNTIQVNQHCNSFLILHGWECVHTALVWSFTSTHTLKNKGSSCHRRTFLSKWLHKKHSTSEHPSVYKKVRKRKKSAWIGQAWTNNNHLMFSYLFIALLFWFRKKQTHTSLLQAALV